jgi:hypothetical protein
MPRFLARLLGLLVGVSLVAGVASALAAVGLKRKAPPLPDPAADEIELVAIMSGEEFASSASAFRGGRVICWYAGLDVDLRDATLDPAGARLEIRTAFGGTRVVVAPGVPVRMTGPAIFGGTMDSTDGPEPTPSAPGLEIAGFTLFGALQVIASEAGEEIPVWAGDHDGDLEQGEPRTLGTAPDSAPV